MASASNREIIGKGNAGIPRDFFQVGFHAYESGLSGESVLYCHMTPEQIELRDSNEPQLVFRARYNRLQKTVGFYIRTVSKESGQHHPDLFAGQLFDQTIVYFGEQGPLTKIQAEWFPWSVNYQQFYTALGNRSFADMTARHEAATHTWTAEQARRNRFSVVKSVLSIREPQKILTVFEKAA